MPYPNYQSHAPGFQDGFAVLPLSLFSPRSHGIRLVILIKLFCSRQTLTGYGLSESDKKVSFVLVGIRGLRKFTEAVKRCAGKRR